MIAFTEYSPEVHSLSPPALKHEQFGSTASAERTKGMGAGWLADDRRGIGVGKVHVATVREEACRHNPHINDLHGGKVSS